MIELTNDMTQWLSPHHHGREGLAAGHTLLRTRVGGRKPLAGGQRFLRTLNLPSRALTQLPLRAGPPNLYEIV